MNVSLNFGKADKERIKKFLSAFPAKKTMTEFEEARAVIEDCTVTLYHTGKLTIQGNQAELVKEIILKSFKLSNELILGIDEAGRGEHFGPMVIAGVLGKTDALRELRDSKKVSDKEKKSGIVSENSLAQAIVSLNAEYLDRLRNKGLNLNEIEGKIIDSFNGLFKELEGKLSVKVDGSPLPAKDKSIEFIPKGDDLEPVIGAASVTAKNFREKSSDKKERKSWKKKTA